MLIHAHEFFLENTIWSFKPPPLSLTAVSRFDSRVISRIVLFHLTCLLPWKKLGAHACWLLTCARGQRWPEHCSNQTDPSIIRDTSSVERYGMPTAEIWIVASWVILARQLAQMQRHKRIPAVSEAQSLNSPIMLSCKRFVSVIACIRSDEVTTVAICPTNSELLATGGEERFFFVRIPLCMKGCKHVPWHDWQTLVNSPWSCHGIHHGLSLIDIISHRYKIVCIYQAPRSAFYAAKSLLFFELFRIILCDFGISEMLLSSFW